jgi:hypothetical protein
MMAVFKITGAAAQGGTPPVTAQSLFINSDAVMPGTARRAGSLCLKYC